MFNKCKKLINIMLFLLLAGLLSGCNFKNISNVKSVNENQIFLNSEEEVNAKIETESVEYRNIPLQITIPAQFKPISKYLDRIYAPIYGKIINVLVEPGRIVKRGEPLVMIKSDEIGQIQLSFLDEYIIVDSNVKQMSAQYNLSKQTYQREKILYNEGIASQAEYQIAYAQFLKDKANLDSLKTQRSALIKVYSQRVALYGGDESSIRKAISTKTIYPFVTLYSNKNGVVLTRKVNPGEIIDKNKELFNIADLSTIWLVGYAFEKDVPHLKIGQNVKGMMQEYPNQNVYGKISYVASLLDEDKKTLEVRADIPNPDFSIKPNIYAEMTVNVGAINALSVPNSALVKYGDYTFAYVMVKPHVYEERKVETGRCNDYHTEVKSGLKKGETVVSKGGFSLLGESIKMKEE